MHHRILGTTMPVLEVSLNAGEMVFAESGELSWLTQTIGLQTSTSAGGQKGGFFAALGRAFSGGSLFMTEYQAQGGAGTVAFAAKLPGQILPLELDGSQSFMVHAHGFLCGTPGVSYTSGLQRKLGAGIFGGVGFILQKLSGKGTAFIELGGEVVTYDLKPGETLRVHPGHVGLFQDSVKLDITTVPGIKNMVFGGDGLFLAALTGPGRVWLQSMTVPQLAHSIAHYLPHPSSNEGAASVVGSLLGG